MKSDLMYAYCKECFEPNCNHTKIATNNIAFLEKEKLATRKIKELKDKIRELENLLDPRNIKTDILPSDKTFLKYIDEWELHKEAHNGYAQYLSYVYDIEKIKNKKLIEGRNGSNI